MSLDHLMLSDIRSKNHSNGILLFCAVLCVGMGGQSVSAVEGPETAEGVL